MPSSVQRCMWRSGFGLILVLSALFLPGCSELTAELAGTVYLDDEPLSLGEGQRGMLVFRPVAGGATCTGLVGEGGKYRVSTGRSRALVPGDYLVSVRAVEVIKAEVEGGSPGGRPLTPALYADPLTSGLMVTVRRGANRYDIKLDSAAGPVSPPPLEEISEEINGGEAEASDSGNEAGDASGDEGASGPDAAATDQGVAESQVKEAKSNE